MTTAMTKDEKKWRAESDARTLGDAEAIRQDLARLKAALAELDRLNKVREKELKIKKKIVEDHKKTLGKKNKK